MSRPLVLASLILAATAACKPKGGGAGVKDIAGINESGKKASLALVSIRNLTFAQDALKASTDDQVQYARKLMSQPLFALVECADYEQDGQLVESGASMLARLKALSFMSNLFLDEQRALVSFEASSKDKEDAKQLDRKVVHNCAVKSYRLLSYPVIEDVFIRINGMPAQKPTDAAKLDAAHKSYTVAQSIYLSLRDNYTPGKRADESLMVNKLRQMAEEYGDTDREDFKDSLAAADPFYNPCIAAQGMPWWVNEFKKDYACVPVRGHDEQRTFAPGGGAQASYVAFRDRLAGEILDTHTELYADKASGIYTLWEMLSGMADWAKAKGTAAEMAAFLAKPDSEQHFRQILAKLRNDAAMSQGVALTEVSGPRAAEKLKVNYASGLGLAGNAGPTLGFNNRSKNSPVYGGGTPKNGGRPAGGPSGGKTSSGPSGGRTPSGPAGPSGGRSPSPPPVTQPQKTMGDITIKGETVSGTGKDTVVRVGDEAFFPKDSTIYRPGANNFKFDSSQNGADMYTNGNGDRRFAVDQKALDSGKGTLTKQEQDSGETKWNKTTTNGKTEFDHKETSDASKGTFTERMNEANTEMTYQSNPVKDAQGNVIAPGFSVTGPLASNPYNIATADQATQNKVVTGLVGQKNAVMADLDKKTDSAISNISRACDKSPAEVQKMRDDAVKQVRDEQTAMKQQLSAAAEHSRLSGDNKAQLEREMAALDVRADQDVARIAGARTACDRNGAGPLAIPGGGGAGGGAGGGGAAGPLAIPGGGGGGGGDNTRANSGDNTRAGGDTRAGGNLRLTEDDDGCPNENAGKETDEVKAEREKGAGNDDKTDGDKTDGDKTDGDKSGAERAADATSTTAADGAPSTTAPDAAPSDPDAPSGEGLNQNGNAPGMTPETEPTTTTEVPAQNAPAADGSMMDQ